MPATSEFFLLSGNEADYNPTHEGVSSQKEGARASSRHAKWIRVSHSLWSGVLRPPVRFHVSRELLSRYMKTSLFAWLRSFVDSALPFSCHLCKAQTRWGSVLCSSCAESLKHLIQTPFVVTDLTCGCPVFTMGIYEDSLAAAIKIGKYRPSRKLFCRLSEISGKVCMKSWHNPWPEVFIPVPLHPAREEKRGFNQAALLARELAKSLGAKFSPALTRTRETRPQADCDESERASNLSGAFDLTPNLLPAAFQGRRLCLIDDVVTTGATMEECRSTVATLKPADVIVLTLAHSPRRFATSQKRGARAPLRLAK